MPNLQKSLKQKAPLRRRNGNGLVGPEDRTPAATEFSCNSMNCGLVNDLSAQTLLKTHPVKNVGVPCSPLASKEENLQSEHDAAKKR